MTRQLSPLADALLGIAALGVFVLVYGGIRLFRRGQRQKGVLMVITAFVLLMNLLIWTV